MPRLVKNWCTGEHAWRTALRQSSGRLARFSHDELTLIHGLRYAKSRRSNPGVNTTSLPLAGGGRFHVDRPNVMSIDRRSKCTMSKSALASCSAC